MLQDLVFRAWEALDIEIGVPLMSPAIREAVERLFNIVDASAYGVLCLDERRMSSRRPSKLLNTLGKRGAKDQ
jgi:hypothetical protein